GPRAPHEALLRPVGGGSHPLRSPRRRSGPAPPAIAAVVLVAGAAALAYRASVSDAREPLTFAVVPFQNVTHDTALDYRSDGIGDEVLNGMAKVKGVQIVGRNAAFRFKNRTGVDAPDLRAVERALGARLLVTGTLRETGGRVIISAQLNDSTSPGEVWSQSFTRVASDLGSITDEIVRQITDTLRAR